MRWPQEEYEILDKLYPEGGSRAAKALGCTARAIARAADRDRARREADFNKRKYAAIAELATLEIVR